MAIDPFVDELLSYLERRETQLLSWGFFDAKFGPNEIERTLASEAPRRLNRLWQTRHASGERLDQLFVRLADAGLLYRPDPGVEAYRTRFGEGVRLIARLRQMFRANQWDNAPTLVSDLKLFLQRRRYPKQDQPPLDCWTDLEPNSASPDLEREVFLALAQGKDGGLLSFSGFQRRSFARIHRAYGQIGVSGTVVSAGTGAGKTKAFYVPALLKVAGDLHRPPFTKIVAIYPRNVLLADQLREALSEAAKLAPLLQQRGLRPIRFGALLGQTPWQDDFDKQQGGTVQAVAWNNWERLAEGFRIPFLRSPIDGSDLVWRNEDRAAGRFTLYPRGRTGGTPHVAQGVIAFTRDELLREPPDVLFLSAEMLNREMGNPVWEQVLGLGQPADRAPRLLLLDEVHAYEGIPGAQIAWILRRWRHWAKLRSLHVVGLSATLRDPVRHLSAVAGIRVDDIVSFSPNEEQRELKSESQEYNLLVKGDAGSGASLLSTTIQTGMLLTRLLTPLSLPPSPNGTLLPPDDYFARKVFGFTDNLDVVNRWMSDLVDAEQRKQLAALRLHPTHRQPPPNPPPSRTEIARMDALGQIWELPRRLGHDLTRPGTVGRCTSQTPGLDADRVLTVATSTLEVGYDDPNVGGVIQHKSPSSIASFVQRKGRAGRKRGTRPWTVVILSDFGRDRWDFQQAERLFSPQIPAIRLPTGNPYVLRIQAAYFLLDWLGRRVRSLYRRGPFTYLVRPTNDAGFQCRLGQVLNELLDCGELWGQFRSELITCLRQPMDADGNRLSEAEIDAVIWRAPRPLLREVIPTLYRKVIAGWQLADPTNAGRLEDAGVRHPLPGFLPQATFSDLEASEVRILLPGQNPSQEALGVGHALFETCPGRASKRYSLRPGDPGNWHPLSANLAGGDIPAPIQSVYPNAIDLGLVDGIRVYQPTEATLIQHVPLISESSYATWQWQSAFTVEGPGSSLPMPGSTTWAGAIRSVVAFLHRESSSVEVTRFAPNNRYEVLTTGPNGRTIRGRVLLQCTSDSRPADAAVGFRMKVDGLRVRIRAEHLATLSAAPPEIVGRFRVEYFLHLLKDNPTIGQRAGRFQAELLGQTAVAMLSATALRNKCSLQAAQPLLLSVRPAAADKVMRTFFQVADASGLSESRGRRQIRELWSDPVVAAEVAHLEAVLWAPPDAAFHDWCKRRYLATIAQAVRKAVANRDDNVSEDDLTADVVWDGHGNAEIFLTEQSPGGLGLIEQVFKRLRGDPSQFTDGLDHALDFCPRCENTAYVRGVVSASLDLTAHRRLARAFAVVRTARDMSATERAKATLRTALRESGFPATRDGIVSILTRVLRPGSNRSVDRVMNALNRLWRRREATLGIAVDLRVFAYLCVRTRRTREVLNRVIGQIGRGATATRRQLFAIVQQMLLLDCADSCPECLDQPNRYAPNYKPSRNLARFYLGRTGAEISVEDNPSDWLALVRSELAARAVTRLRVSTGMVADVTSKLPALLAHEIEVDYLLLPVRVRRVEEDGTDLVITLDLRDAAYV
ncbi:protein DpdJ [Tuwongella immobilis]|uniref:Helicase ATP-binding domain-containing protein n=1 Tax=Tuwongella immobilis TaxID=692036 RepID=A0A6C2YWV7_9BACT|nr:protein DpdJ [Tuwongella immobilis]VIP05332.1 Putative helicase OS=Sinorhizobium fredii USDA 257 GN=USDA257_c04380 PE=4 SV=1: Helicase_C [Tuwongella immobilis]VTS08020.1 Putative helicase OS=Sinorhizobium fredii USDA 257 GN=USDA257_c04380 PE=4 SV=1: Helicase_C [Tuwongella immobilis]